MNKRPPLKCLKSTVKMITTSSTSELATVATKRITGRRCQQARQSIAERDGYRCQICGRIAIKGEADHIVPLHLGGRDDPDNMQWTHVECHAEKSKAEGNYRNGGH